MKKILISIAALAAISSSAFAADISLNYFEIEGKNNTYTLKATRGTGKPSYVNYPLNISDSSGNVIGVIFANKIGDYEFIEYKENRNKEEFLYINCFYKKDGEDKSHREMFITTRETQTGNCINPRDFKSGGLY